ncbi:MAG: CofH family radical SAM protein [Elusimicrobiales bacterium]|nr:CofH family radical SAM protein [Elusimicrobiales bacterium]
MTAKESLKKKILAGRRISPAEADALFSWDLLELGGAADMRRRLIHPVNTVGFILDRIINFTNVCEAACDFCAFHAGAALKPYELSMPEILSKIEELQALGGTQVMLQGGLHPRHTLATYTGMVREIKKRFPAVCLHSFSPSELAHISAKSAVPLDRVIADLQSAGLDSVPGAADMLVDRIRAKVSRKKIRTDEWVEVMRALHRHGMKSSATMTYGMGETQKERIAHLEVVRRVQDETGIFRAFIPWSFSPKRTKMESMAPATGIDYLKIVAVSRIFLDNIRYIQAGWLTEGLKLAQIALAMGANDMGGVLTEEKVVKATGAGTKAGMAEFIDLIKNAGKIPVLRDSDYKILDRRPGGRLK